MKLPNVFRIINVFLGLTCAASVYSQGVNYLDNLYDFIENTSVFELNQEKEDLIIFPKNICLLMENGSFYIVMYLRIYLLTFTK